MMTFRLEVRVETTGLLILDQSGNVPLAVPRIGEKICTRVDSTKFIVKDVVWEYGFNLVSVNVIVAKYYA